MSEDAEKQQEGKRKLLERMKAAIERKDSDLITEICKHCSEVEALSFLQLFDDAIDDEIETMVSALFVITKRAFSDLNDKIEKIVHRFICYGHSRFIRKAALSALHELKSKNIWKDYFTLMNVLEEPQFHLVGPALPYFDRILCVCKTTMKDECLPWYWVQLLFVKALDHPNGWIRVWAAQKIILSTLLATLNNSDVYWRLNEDANLKAFLENFGFFLERVSSAGSKDDESNLVSSVCLVVRCSTYLILDVYRPLLNTVIRIPCIPLRICTTANFLKFFFKLAERNWHEACCFASLLSELPEDKYGFLLQEFFYNTTFTETLAGSVVGELDELQRSYALDHGRGYKIAMGISHSVLAIDSYCYIHDFKIVDILLQLYAVISNDKLFEKGNFFIFRYRDVEQLCISRRSEESQYFEYALVAYLDTRLFTDVNEVFDPRRFNALHKKLLTKYISNFDQWLFRSVLLCNKTTSISSRAALSSVAAAVISRCHNIPRTVWDVILNFLLTKEIDSRAGFEISLKVANYPNIYKVLEETVTKNKSVLWQNFIAEHSFDSISLFRFCITSLKIFFSWDCRRAILNLLLAVLKKAAIDSMIEESIEVVMKVANEEKKTHNYIPVITDVLTICTLECTFHTVEVAKIAVKAVEKLCAESDRNVQIAVVLSDAFYRAKELLCIIWFPVLIKMCAFGPICKKDTTVLYLAVQMAYGMEESLPNSSYEKLHECAQYSRLRALQTISWICKNRSDSADVFIQETFVIIDVLDTVKNRHVFWAIFGSSSENTLIAVTIAYPWFREQRSLGKIRILLYKIFERSFATTIYKTYCELDTRSTVLQQRSCIPKIYWNRERSELAAARIGTICSWIAILMHVTKINRTDMAFARCFTLFHPWCTAQNFIVRCTSLAAVRLLWNIAGDELRSQFGYLRSIIEFDAEKAGNAKRVIDQLCNDFYFAYLNENTDYSLETVLTVLPEKVGLTAQDGIAAHLLKSIRTEDFACVRCHSNDLNQYSSFIFGQTQQQRQQEIQGSDSVLETSGIQRKFNAVNVNRVSLEGVSLIVVASLLDKAANLGGICRTCEVLGVEKLIVADLSKIKDRNFMALSMSSENWMNLEQSRPEDLPNLLLSFRDSGYAIIGAEQTTNSTPLHKIHLPSKMVLLLGNEKVGIPMDLMGYLDKTVEILQIGHTKSLNVHVTGALFIYRFFEEFIATKT
uniref:tRNA/rRNA methyltransferase SpoU type domain-containing protein n=1 Tax=Setaria digitata TaxID=48799 RepID=A0A915PFS3_9BILA